MGLVIKGILHWNHNNPAPTIIYLAYMPVTIRDTCRNYSKTGASGNYRKTKAGYAHSGVHEISRPWHTRITYYYVKIVNNSLHKTCMLYQNSLHVVSE